MKILKGVEIPITICISYTIISIGNAILSLCTGHQTVGHWNSIMMLLWTTIAVLILSIYHLFDEVSPIIIMILQYLVATSLVMLTIFISGFFEEISENGYRDAFVSFTVPYIIGAASYYISVFRAAKKQDKLLQEIKDRTKRKTE